MKVLVLGGSSLLGSYFLREFHGHFDCGAIQRRSFVTLDPKLANVPVYETKDLPSPEFLQEKIKDHDYVINFISEGRVDFCEKNPEISNKLNYEFPIAVAYLCSKLQKDIVVFLLM